MRVTNPRRSVRLGTFPVRSEKSNLPPLSALQDEPLSAVGLSERGAREQNLKFRVKKEMTSTWDSSRRVAETYSGYKVLVEENTDRILGAHILGSDAGELINLFALAIRSGMRATDLQHILFAYPTSGSNVTRML
jgi:glutathione reductase (NADPH)